MNYKNKRIVIFGLGGFEKGSGISTAIFLAEKGAGLLITDLKTEKELAYQLERLKKYKNIEHVLGRHRKKDFENADYIFRNPSVPKNSPYLKIARQKKIPIINDWSIFFEEYPDNLVIGVTGTKGKSTTATLVYEILKAANKDTLFCGNIGQSPLSVLNKIKKGTIIVAEFSSWLLSVLKISPQIAVITNLMPDHLDKYKDLGEYYDDKKNIFKFQNKDDYLILGKGPSLANLPRTDLGKIKSEIIYSSEPAISVAEILKIPKDTIQKSLKNFKGVPGRLEFICEKNGTKYYNDTCATTPDATIYALQQLKKHKKKIILIVGGVDKKLDYKKLAKEIPKYVKALILFKGTASEKLLKQFNIQHSTLNIHDDISNMKRAVNKAKKLTVAGDVILLSPAAASFNLFKNEFDRGEQFVKEIKKL